MNRTVSLYYCDIPNFGDQLNVDLLNYYGLDVQIADAASADLCCIGSLLGHLPDDFDGVVFGTGAMTPECHKSMLSAQISIVRGPLTAKQLLGGARVLQADPGLLISQVFPQRIRSDIELGIVPHYVDAQDSRLARLVDTYGDRISLIDVTRPAREVAESISSCKHILSSSLHGIIAADSLGIPSGWLPMGNRVTGGDFKFRDYAASIHRKLSPVLLDGKATIESLCSETSLVSKRTIANKIMLLNDRFKNLPETLDKQQQLLQSPPRSFRRIIGRRLKRKIRHLKSQLSVNANSD